jgi:hypothetical protein
MSNVVGEKVKSGGFEVPVRDFKAMALVLLSKDT